MGKRFADWQIASWRIAGRGERLASTRGRGGASAAACGCRTFCAEERLAGYRLACCGTTPRFAASPDNLQRFLEVAAKNDASARKTSVASSSTSRNCRSRTQLATKIKQSGAHPCRTAYTRAFFGSKSTRPLANNPSDHRPDPDPSPIIPRYIGPTQAPGRQSSRPLVQARPPVNSPPGHRSRQTPYQQPFRPSDRPRPLTTNTPPSHRPDAEGPCDAAPYCACATPSPSGAPTGQGPLPLCAQHHPSSIRS